MTVNRLLYYINHDKRLAYCFLTYSEKDDKYTLFADGLVVARYTAFPEASLVLTNLIDFFDKQQSSYVALREYLKNLKNTII